jgi:hypothetical protein
VGSDAPNAVLLQKKYYSHAPKRSKTLEGTLEKRSRNAPGIGQRSISMHSTNNDGGVANSQRVGEGCKPKLACACQAFQKAKGNPWV